MKKTLNSPPIEKLHEPLPLIKEHKKQIKKIVLTPKDILDKVDKKKQLTFDSESEKNAFKNHLINDETISKFIESSFNGNILYLGPLDEERADQHWDTQAYVEGLCMNKKKVMGKIHNIAYGDFFSAKFDSKKIDDQLQDLELEEKLMLIDNIIDYLYVNFTGLGGQKGGAGGDDSDLEFGSEEEADYTVDNGGVEAKKNLTKIEAMKQIQLDKKRVAEKALQKKLMKKGIMPSMSLSFKRHQVALAVDG